MALVPALAAILLTGVPQESPYTKDLLKVGSSAPSFSLEGLSGKVSLDTGRPAVVVFWHVGSKQAAPLLSKASSLGDKYGRKLQVLLVDSGDTQDRVSAFLKDNGLKVNVGLSDPSKDGTAASYGVKGFPTVFVIDSSGKITYRDHKPSEADVESEVAQVCK